MKSVLRMTMAAVSLASLALLMGCPSSDKSEAEKPAATAESIPAPASKDPAATPASPAVAAAETAAAPKADSSAQPSAAPAAAPAASAAH